MADRIKLTSIIRNTSHRPQTTDPPPSVSKRAPPPSSTGEKIERPRLPLGSQNAATAGESDKVRTLEDKVARMERLLEQERTARQRLETAVQRNQQGNVSGQSETPPQGSQDSLPSRGTSQPWSALNSPPGLPGGGQTLVVRGECGPIVAGLQAWEDVTGVLKEKRTARRAVEDRVAALCQRLGQEMASLAEYRAEEERVAEELVTWTGSLVSRLQVDSVSVPAQSTSASIAGATSDSADDPPTGAEQHVQQKPGGAAGGLEAPTSLPGQQAGGAQEEGEGSGPRLASQYYKGGGGCGAAMAGASAREKEGNSPLGRVDRKVPERESRVQDVLRQLQGLKMEIGLKLGQQGSRNTDAGRLNPEGGGLGEGTLEESREGRKAMIPPVYSFVPPPLSRAVDSKLEIRKNLPPIVVEREVHIVELDKAMYPPTRGNSGNLSPLVRAPSSQGSGLDR